MSLLLNIQRGENDTSTPDDLVRRFAERLWGKDWPGTTRPRVSYDPRSMEPDGPAGVLHAKAVVADEEAVFDIATGVSDGEASARAELSTPGLGQASLDRLKGELWELRDIPERRRPFLRGCFSAPPRCR